MIKLAGFYLLLVEMRKKAKGIDAQLVGGAWWWCGEADDVLGVSWPVR